MERPKLGEAPEIVLISETTDHAVVEKKPLAALVVYVAALGRYIAGELERCEVASKDAEAP